MTLFLYVITVAIWGTSWIAIYYQLGSVEIIASIFYRFGLSSIILVPIVLMMGKARLGSIKDQFFFMAQGACLFSFNFICFYNATQYIPSGLVSVIFSLAAIYNALNGRLFFGVRVDSYTWIASAVGVMGLMLLMASEINLDTDWQTSVKGIGLAALGTLFFSLGNMISVRHCKQSISPLQSNIWALPYGSLILLSICEFNDVQFTIGDGPEYLWSLFYLAVFGTVIGFTAYLSLVNRVGASGAAYTTILFPIIALTLSSMVEGYDWEMGSFLGLVLIVIGNLISVSKGFKIKPSLIENIERNL